MKPNRQIAKQQGFTLIELLVVLAILAMLAGLVGPAVMDKFGNAQRKTAEIQIKDLESGLEIYKLEVGRYPNNEQGLQALMVKPANASGWNGPYLKGKNLPKDPWDQDYVYRFPGSNGGLDITSYGADGQPGGEGDNADITN